MDGEDLVIRISAITSDLIAGAARATAAIEELSGATIEANKASIVSSRAAAAEARKDAAQQERFAQQRLANTARIENQSLVTANRIQNSNALMHQRLQSGWKGTETITSRFFTGLEKRAHSFVRGAGEFFLKWTKRAALGLVGIVAAGAGWGFSLAIQLEQAQVGFTRLLGSSGAARGGTR